MNDASEFEQGPVTRYTNAEQRCADLELQLAASELQRIKDNEHLLGERGEMQAEIDRLRGMDTLAFEMGSQLKCLVTTLCLIISRTKGELGHYYMIKEIPEWEEMVACWEEARDRLNLNERGEAAEV